MNTYPPSLWCIRDRCGRPLRRTSGRSEATMFAQEEDAAILHNQQRESYCGIDLHVKPMWVLEMLAPCRDGPAVGIPP